MGFNLKLILLFQHWLSFVDRVCATIIVRKGNEDQSSFYHWKKSLDDMKTMHFFSWLYLLGTFYYLLT